MRVHATSLVLETAQLQHQFQLHIRERMWGTTLGMVLALLAALLSAAVATSLDLHLFDLSVYPQAVSGRSWLSPVALDSAVP